MITGSVHLMSQISGKGTETLILPSANRRREAAGRR
jgi:hypothetical protein